jgi:hypothetical protein
MCVGIGYVGVLMDTVTVKVLSRLLLYGFKTLKAKILNAIYFRIELQHIRVGLHVNT